MRIKEIFPQLDLDQKIRELEITGISEDSRQAKKKDIFFVRERKNFDIFSVLTELEEKIEVFVGGINSQEKLRQAIKNKPLILVKDVDLEFYRAVDLVYDFKNEDFKAIGVTGTNGKTTIANLVYHLLIQMGENASLIGTIRYLIGGKLYPSSHTTPDYLTLRKLIKEGRERGVRFLVMEVSSHAIEQERIRGIDFLNCVFTNLTRDHLDYHRTMSEYFNVKKKLFFHNRGIYSLINTDDYYGRKLFSQLKHKAVSYGLRSLADLRAENIRLSKEYTIFDLIYKGKRFAVKTWFLGRYNILNILAAVGTLACLGFSLPEVIGFIPSLKEIPGRLQKAGRDVFIDYAHTPDALRKVLVTLREIGYQRVICVFGCGGDRDRGKRALMGKAAGNYADFSFITADNPRSEDPGDICRQIKEGFKKNNYRILIEREEAIKQALKYRRKYKDCCVLVAGKGHEQYQIIGNRRIPFEDRKIVRKFL